MRIKPLKQSNKKIVNSVKVGSSMPGWLKILFAASVTALSTWFSLDMLTKGAIEMAIAVGLFGVCILIYLVYLIVKAVKGEL